MKYGWCLFVGVAAVAASFGQNVDTDGDRLPDDYEIGFGRYEVVRGQFTWDQANLDAGARGGHLATVVSGAEWEAMHRALGDQMNGQNLWLGGTRFGTENFWHWITNEDWTFSNWRAGEPTGALEGLDARKAYSLQLGREGFELGWAAAFGEEGVYPVDGYILEVGLYTDFTKPDTDGNGLPDGAEQAIGHSYEVVVFPAGVTMSWSECEVDAKARGGHLVSVTTLIEHDVVGFWLSRTPQAFGVRSPFGILRQPDANSRLVFRWLSGEPFFFSLYLPGSGCIPSVNNIGFVPVFRPGGPRSYYWCAELENAVPFPGYVFERDMSPPPAAFDTDLDLIVDVDELLIWGTDPLKPDTDLDGFGDGDEILAGTDPLDPASSPAPKLSLSREGDLVIPTKEGVQYRLQVSDRLSNWAPYGEPFVGTGQAIHVQVQFRPELDQFWRAIESR